MDGLIEGRVCHYVLDDGKEDYLEPEAEPKKPKHRAATISEVIDNEKGVVCLQVNLSPRDVRAIVNGSTLLVVDGVRYDPEMSQGTWHWVEKA